MKLKGIVLAGGKSSRFGSDKALARCGGMTLLEHAVNVLTGLQLDPAVIASSGKDYAFLKCTVHNDIVREKGPIGGLLTAFSVCPGQDLLVLTCDMPFVTGSVLSRLVRAYDARRSPTFFRSHEIHRPFPGIYPSSCKRAAQLALSSGRLSLKYFLATLPNLKTISEPDDRRCFINMNTPEDLPAAPSQFSK